MTTYSVRCRNSSCRHRRVVQTHPDSYKVIPKCPACSQRKGWRLENRDYNKRDLCNCSGPFGRNNESFPHNTTHPCCDKHPQGIYNQALARGVAHEDIPAEFWPREGEPPMTDPMTRWDYYAASALAGAVGNPNGGGNSPRDFAHWAAQVADSLMLERAKRMEESRNDNGF